MGKMTLPFIDSDLLYTGRRKGKETTQRVYVKGTTEDYQERTWFGEG
jgi:hypothetical protein